MIASDNFIITVQAHENSISSLKWDPRGLYLVTISPDNTCKIWEVCDNELLSKHMIPFKHEPLSITWSPLVGIGSRPLLLAVGTNYGSVHVFRVPDEKQGPEKNPELLFSAQGHSYNGVTALCVDNSGLLLASACLKNPSGIVNIFSLHDGTLVYTTTGVGGVNVCGMQWIITNDCLAIAFSKSKSICLLNYNINTLNKNIFLAGVRKTLLKKGIQNFKHAHFFKIFINYLPKILLNQYKTEKLAVQTGVHLMHSVFLKSLASLAVLLELDKYLCYKLHAPNNKGELDIISKYHWLHLFGVTTKMADGLIKRSDLTEEVLSFSQVLINDTKKSDLQNVNWSLKQDEQIMRWVTQRPHDWQIGGKCKAYLWGSDRHGQLAELGYSASVPSEVKSFSTARKIICGQNCTFIIEANGTVLACGEGSYGRLGQGNSDDLHSLSVISSLQGFVITDLATSVGSDGHSLALAESGEVFSWGDGDYGNFLFSS